MSRFLIIRRLSQPSRHQAPAHNSLRAGSLLSPKGEVYSDLGVHRTKYSTSKHMTVARRGYATLIFWHLLVTQPLLTVHRGLSTSLTLLMNGDLLW